MSVKVRGMKTIRYFLMMLVCMMGCVTLCAQSFPYHFHSIGVDDGLPDNYVKTVFGLPDGRLGVRTTVLLNFYDGTRFVSYPFGNQTYACGVGTTIPVQYVDKRNRLWLKEKGYLRLFSLETERFIRPETVFQEWNMKKPVDNLFVDNEKRIWVTDTEGTLFLFDDETDKLTKMIPSDEQSQTYGNLVTLETIGRVCWLVYANGVLRCLDMDNRKFIRQETFLQDRLEVNEEVFIRTMDNKDFWLMWRKGVGYYKGSTYQWKEISQLDYEECGALNGMDIDSGNNLWVATSQKGLYWIDSHSLLPVHATDGTVVDNHAQQKYVHSVYFDRLNNTIWAGYYNEGLECWHPSMNNVEEYHPANVKGEWPDHSVHSMLELADGTILVGSQRGMCIYDPQTVTMKRCLRELDQVNIRSLYRDKKGRIWIGTYKKGLLCWENDRLSHFLETDSLGIEQTNIRSLIEDATGQMWVSVAGGVGRFFPEENRLELLSERFPALSRYRICNSLAIDSQGRLVVGADNGMYRYDVKEDKVWIPEIEHPESPLVTEGSSKNNCILADSRGLLWIGTQFGMKILYPNGNVDVLSIEAGLANATIQSIQEDVNHDIWVSTINAIYRIIVNTDDANNPYRVSCLIKNTTSHKNGLYEFCSLKTRNGQMYFGKISGFCSFSPENVALAPCTRSPFFASLRLFGKQIGQGEEYNGRVLFEKTVDCTRQVELEYDENFVTFDFASLNFVNSSQTYFRYRLKGLEEKWAEQSFVKEYGTVTYSNLSPGKYEFVVQAAGNDHQWSEEAVFNLTIRPPFWKTYWAYMVYLLTLSMLVYGYMRYLERKNNRRLAYLKEKETVRQQEELNQMKFRFFVNVSHELRTPLTLILSPLEILRKKISDEKTSHQLDVMYKNAQELHRLINQLLDFRKVEMRKEKLHLSTGDLVEFMNSVYALFQPTSEDKNLDFRFETDVEHLFMYFDHDKVHKIINNLLSNAFKYTPVGGTVWMNLEETEQGGRKYAVIKVSDTGIGMEADQLPHIFDRFYQVQDTSEGKSGSGIGLHLVKEYTQMHEGEVQVESDRSGTTFTVRIPVDMKPLELVAEQQPMGNQDEPEAEIQAGIPIYKYTILVVDDNEDVRFFLKEQLGEYYNILEAPDGEIAEQLAIEHNPDMVVSDIMMPKVDGMELCRRLKTNLQTSHIPVMLVTARTADDIKISSYEVGADSYIPKPFNLEMMLVRIRKLIEQKEKRWSEFKDKLDVNPSVITITSIDEQLVKKALDFVERNMDNPAYNVDMLSGDMAMSRMTFYRKLQSITGQSPNEFIKTIRLKRAAQLLENSQFSVSEVADRCGFSSSSYFAKCFKAQFGVLPKQYAENQE